MRWQCAIDVGSYYIKVVEGKKKNGRLVIRRIGYFPNPVPNLKEGLIEREQDIFAKALKDFLSKHKIISKQGILSTGGAGTVIHYFEIPDIPKEEIESAIQLEIMQVVPGGTKNLEYDYLLLPGKDNKKTVLFVGYYKERCEFFTSTIQMAGIKPLIMDYDGLALLNSFRFFHKKQEDIISILNIGHRTSNLVVAYNKSGFILIRDIPFAGKNIIQTVSSDKNILSEEAEIFAKKKENRGEMKNIISSDISELLLEVKTSMEYFRTKTEKLPQTLFITGGCSVLPGLSETLEREINIKTRIWNPLEELDPKEILLPVEIKNKGILFAVSLGLVLREIR